MNRRISAAALAALSLAVPAGASATQWHAPFLVHLHAEQITSWRVNHIADPPSCADFTAQGSGRQKITIDVTNGAEAQVNSDGPAPWQLILEWAPFDAHAGGHIDPPPATFNVDRSGKLKLDGGNQVCGTGGDGPAPPPPRPDCGTRRLQNQLQLRDDQGNASTGGIVDVRHLPWAHELIRTGPFKALASPLNPLRSAYRNCPFNGPYNIIDAHVDFPKKKLFDTKVPVITARGSATVAEGNADSLPGETTTTIRWTVTFTRSKSPDSQRPARRPAARR